MRYSDNNERCTCSKTGKSTVKLDRTVKTQEAILWPESIKRGEEWEIRGGE